MGEHERNPDSQDDKDELAKALPKLTPEQISHVSPHLVHETYRAGSTIISQGDAPDRFYIIVDGMVEIWHEDLNGELHLVSQSGPGEYFGETGLLQSQPRTATVRVSSFENVEVLALDRQYFQEMMEESKATESQLAREMIQRLIDLSDFQS
jgi:CRP-like cAMP-binding protein